MLKVIDLPALRTLLQHDGLQTTLDSLRESLRADFARWHDFDKNTRIARHYAHGVIELMPISDERLYAVKYVNGHPDNPRHGRAAVVALGILADVESGYPVLLSEMTLLTALRTAATSALVAQFCARPESACMAMIGIGTQAAFQAVALSGVLPLMQLRCYDKRPSAVERLRANIEPYGLDVIVCDSVAQALDGADLVTTATAVKRHQRLLGPADTRPGMHINAVGGDCPGKTELDPALLDTARVIVEFEPQTRVEGELQLAPPELAVTEVWQLVAGTATARADNDEITLFDSVGFALEDFSVLRYVHERTDALGLGRPAALLPDRAAAADLFAAVSPRPPVDVAGRMG